MIVSSLIILMTPRKAVPIPGVTLNIAVDRQVMHVYVCMCVYIYIYIYILHICIYVFIVVSCLLHVYEVACARCMPHA